MFRQYSNPFAPGLRFFTIQQPSYFPEEGAGTGGEGTGGGETGGLDGTGGGDGGEGDGGGEFYEFKDENQRFKFPGMAKPMTVKEYNAAVLPRAQYEGTIKAVGELAKAINEGRRKPAQQPSQQQQRPQQQQQTQRPDVLAALEANELPTGKDLVAALRNIDETRMTPLTKLVVAMAERLKMLEGHTGSVVQERDERDFGGELDRTITSLKLPKAAGAEVLSEMARDLFLSFDDADRPRLRGETFQKLFAARFEQTRKFFRELEKATATAKQQELRKKVFTRPGGNASANGKRQPVVSNRQRAAALFSTESPT